MISSMTGFASEQITNELGSFSCELRSVNQRYFEFSIRLPEQFRSLEMPLRELAKHQCQRGKIEAFVRYQANISSTQDWEINDVVLSNLVNATKKIEKITGQATTSNSLELLRWPGVLEETTIDNEVLQKTICDLFNKTLEKLVIARQREGNELKLLLEQRLSLISDEIKTIKKYMHNFIALQKEKLQEKIQHLQVTLDPQRLEQEIVLLAQKADIAEEIDRLTTHAAEIQHTLTTGGTVGRRLDFLIQELHREANTLGAKSLQGNITNSSIEMRVAIEQMREQVQNVE